MDIYYIDEVGSIDELDQRVYEAVKKGWRFAHREKAYVCKACRLADKIKTKNSRNTAMIMLSDLADHMRKKKLQEHYRSE